MKWEDVRVGGAVLHDGKAWKVSQIVLGLDERGGWFERFALVRTTDTGVDLVVVDDARELTEVDHGA